MKFACRRVIFLCLFGALFLRAPLAASCPDSDVTPYIHLNYDLFGNDKLKTHLLAELGFRSDNFAGSHLLGEYWDLGGLLSRLQLQSQDVAHWFLKPRKSVVLRKKTEGNKVSYENEGWKMEQKGENAKVVRKESLSPSYHYRKGRIWKYDFGPKDGSFVVRYIGDLPMQIEGSDRLKVTMDYSISGCGQKRIKTISSNGSKFEFQYGQFKIFSPDGKEMECLLPNNIRLSNGREIKITYKGELFDMKNYNFSENKLPRNWRYSIGTKTKTNVMEIEISDSERIIKRSYRWDVEFGSKIESDGKYFVCAFDPESRKREMGIDSVKQSFQINEVDPKSGAVLHERKWDYEKGLLSNVDFRKGTKEEINYLLKSSYSAILPRKKTRYLNDKKIFEEITFFDNNLIPCRKMVFRDGKTETVDILKNNTK